MKVFIATPFAEQYVQPREQVQQLLKALGHDCICGDGIAGQELSPGVRVLIDGCDLVVALMWRDQRFADKDSWSTHHWVTSEAEYAANQGKRVVRLVEQGVLLSGMYSSVSYITVPEAAWRSDKNWTPVLLELLQSVRGHEEQSARRRYYLRPRYFATALLACVVASWFLGQAYLRAAENWTQQESERDAMLAFANRYTEDIVSNVELKDDLVELWLTTFKGRIDNFSSAASTNTRALRLYKREAVRARDHNNTFRRDELKRALRWATFAYNEDPTQKYPIWNAACFNGLMGDATEAGRWLELLRPTVGTEEGEEFRIKICAERDFCPVSEDAKFLAYVGDYGRNCTSISRDCSAPAPHAK